MTTQMPIMTRSTPVAAAVHRKARAGTRQVPRAVNRLRATDADYRERPPIFLTTVPKSGTHLLQQVYGAVPNVVDWGTFIVARSPAMRYLRRSGHERSCSALARKVRRAVPGELLKAHLGFSPEVLAAARSRGAFIVVLARDPRGVAVSTAHYLATAAPWHALHRAFRRLTHEERLRAAICGVGDPERGLPDIGTRLSDFIPWTEHADLVVRYEDLAAAPRLSVREIVASYHDEAAGVTWSVDDVAGRALRAIDPSRSHTFREGRPDGWRDELTESMSSLTIELATDFCERFHYPVEG